MSSDSRLQHGTPLPVEPALQQLLAQANLEYAVPRDESAAFRRLTLELERRRPERGLHPWLWVCAGVGAAAFALLLVQARWYGSVASVQLAAEPPVVAPLQREPARSAISDPEAALEPAPDSVADSAPDSVADSAPEVPVLESPARTPLSRPDEGPRRTRRDAVTAVRPVERKLAPAVEEDCLALAREGAPRPAERCFERRAQGAGLSAEMALYELARLRRDVLGDAEGALGALGDYRQRFPAGSLRNEVDVSRIELLARLQRGQEALSASEQLLATPAGRERAAELRLLRGNVYRTTGSLREAVGEYASAERLGGSLGEEAAFLRAQCLEALGDVAAARQAYARAAQSVGPRRNEARERLAALTRAAP
jgi:predicted negative regulator of RcsB-dependent stress response